MHDWADVHMCTGSVAELRPEGTGQGSGGTAAGGKPCAAAVSGSSPRPPLDHGNFPSHSITLVSSMLCLCELIKVLAGHTVHHNPLLDYIRFEDWLQQENLGTARRLNGLYQDKGACHVTCLNVCLLVISFS